MANKKVKLSIVIPVLNEGDNLNVLLRVLKGLIDLPHEVLIVYDMPNDNSLPVVKSMQKKYGELKLVYNKLGRGVINAIKSGVARSKGEYILVIAADDIGPVLVVKDMVSLMDNGCDMVNGTRYAHGGKNVGTFISKFLSIFGNKLFYALSDSALSDPTLGVKMFRKDLFNKIKLESNPIGWAVSFEFAIKTQMLGYKVGEVPIVSLNRLFGGESTFKPLPWIVEYSKWFLWGIAKFPRSSFKKNIFLKIPDNKS